jgi:hypothetical protein
MSENPHNFVSAFADCTLIFFIKIRLIRSNNRLKKVGYTEASQMILWMH